MEAVNIIMVGMSYIDFILAMFVVILIAYCFLGRNVKITRGMVISACILIVFELAVTLLLSLNSEQLKQMAYEIADNPVYVGSGIDVDAVITMITEMVVNVVAFLFAFVFYMVAFKEHRFLRALEATICLYVYYFYIQNMIQGSIVFIAGGSVNFIQNDIASSGIGLIYTVTIIADFVIDVFLILLLYLGFYRKQRRYIIRVPFRILFVLWVILSSLLIVIPMAESQVETNHYFLSISFGIIIPVVCIVAPIVIVTIAAERYLREQNEYQANYLNAELEYIEQYKRSQTETRAFRHDIINNLSLAKMMLDEGRIDEAKAHISDLLGEVKALSPQFVTGDEMLDMIVSLKADKMREHNIRFACDGIVDGGLDMKPTDCCSIFANALDNSIEAAAGSSDPYVNMTIKRTSKFFVIKISNSCRDKVDVKLIMSSNGYTSKPDKEHHGFGLSNIRSAAERYNCIVKTEFEDSVFALSVMIPRNK